MGESSAKYIARGAKYLHSNRLWKTDELHFDTTWKERGSAAQISFQVVFFLVWVVVFHKHMTSSRTAWMILWLLVALGQEVAKKWEQIPKKSRLEPGLSRKDIPVVLLDPNELNMTVLTKISEVLMKFDEPYFEIFEKGSLLKSFSFTRNQNIIAWQRFFQSSMSSCPQSAGKNAMTMLWPLTNRAGRTWPSPFVWCVCKIVSWPTLWPRQWRRSAPTCTHRSRGLGKATINSKKASQPLKPPLPWLCKACKKLGEA